MKYTHVSKPKWIEIRRGMTCGGPHTFIRIDHVWVNLAGREPFRINGSVITVCRNEHREKRTVHGSTIRDGVHPLWLLARNGLEALLTTQGRARAAAATA